MPTSTVCCDFEGATSFVLTNGAEKAARVLLTLFQRWPKHALPESPKHLADYFLRLMRPRAREAAGIDV